MVLSHRCPANTSKEVTPQASGDQSSEFGYGPGLVPQHLNGRAPSDGGAYQPKAPPVELVEGSPIPRQQRRPRGEVRGYPGEQIAR